MTRKAAPAGRARGAGVAEMPTPAAAGGKSAAGSAADASAAASPAAASPSSAYDLLTLWAALASLAALAAYHAYAAPARGEAVAADAAWLAAASFLACCSLLAATPARAPLDVRVRVVSTVHACVTSYLAWRAAEEMAAGGGVAAAGGGWAAALAPPAPGAGAAASTRWWFAASPGAHGWSTAATSVMAGYVAADVAFAALLDARLLDAGMWAHHAIALASFGSAAALGFSEPYHALVAGTEASTPFLNFYHTWARAGALRTANGAVLWATYLVFRVLNISAVLWHVAHTAAAPEVRAHAPLALPFYITMLVLVFLLNLWWWVAITKIFVRALGALFCGWQVRTRRKAA